MTPTPASRKSRRPAVASYNPLLIKALIEGARKSLELGPFKHGQAVNFRQQLYRLRKAMEEEKHALAGVALRTSIWITPCAGRNCKSTPDAEDHYLILSQGSTALTDAIEKLGITVDEEDDEDLLVETGGHGPFPDYDREALEAGGDDSEKATLDFLDSAEENPDNEEPKG